MWSYYEGILEPGETFPQSPPFSLTLGCVGKTRRQGDTPQLSRGGPLATSCHRRAKSQVYGAAVSIIATGLRDAARAHLLAVIAGLRWRIGYKGDL